jgi:predicted O-linked N-acetylglucosamine transferase (SPINDLY family)
MNTESIVPESIPPTNPSVEIRFYEDWVSREPENIEAFAQLGLAYLFDGELDAAQLTWLGGVAQFSEENLMPATEQLVQILHDKAEEVAVNSDIQISCLIRQYIREIQPENLKNLFFLIRESIALEQFTPELLAEWQVIQILESTEFKLSHEILVETLKQILRIPSEESLKFAEACLSLFSSLDVWSNVLIEVACQVDSESRLGYYAASILECCLHHDPLNKVVFALLPHFYTNCNQYTQAIATARQFYAQSNTIEDKFCANCLLLQTLMKAGAWKELPEVSKHHKILMKQLIESNSTQLELGTIQFLTVYAGSLAYLQDNLAENRWFQNNAGQLFLKNLQANVPRIFKPVHYQPQTTKPKIRVGYIASTLRNHSVGWLSRWLFKYHDKSSFEIYIYLVQQSIDHPFFQEWFAPYADQYTLLAEDIGQAVETIRKDQLDILVDLDSQTLGFTVTIMALKPAPIQITWLGCDASGIPTIDYFIADPYVLPEDAEKYYQEKIWKLPNTYIAVDGFETDLPTLRRSDLGIPPDSVTYLSAQTGSKRDPNTLRLQLRIIKAVPNSYFLIKGLSDQTTLQDLVTAIAQEEEVPLDQIRFLPLVQNEYQHRANLRIADIVLDTYPYNGATTTLEALWMGVPLVTKVGEQFAARNSYAFLMNIGVQEGISWSDEEYVEWGIRLGLDESLRQHISWALMQSRKTSPLWDAKLFTHNMERAYHLMQDELIKNSS